MEMCLIILKMQPKTFWKVLTCHPSVCQCIRVPVLVTGPCYLPSVLVVLSKRLVTCPVEYIRSRTKAVLNLQQATY